MITDPAIITVNDTALIAAATFREHGHKWLPVVQDVTSRRIAGVIRARKMIARIMQVVGPPSAPVIAPAPAP